MEHQHLSLTSGYTGVNASPVTATRDEQLFTVKSAYKEPAYKELLVIRN